MKYVVGITTTKPSSTLTPGGGGGCLTLMDPKTGAILSSMRSNADLSGKAGMGISSLSLFPSTFALPSNSKTQLAIAYGGNSLKKGDNNAVLVSIRSAASPPILHWKCRLPEAEMSGGLIVSPCGYYIIGGGASGSCYIWTSLGGKLLATFKSHYRACTCLEWSDCGRYLVTGGADGLIHLFSLMDLVDVSTRKSRRGVSPMHTFSVHHFPVTSLLQLPSGRMASSAEDGQVLVLELFSKQVLLNIQLPHGIKSMTCDNGRIFLGSMQGTIYSVDTNAYAMHQTEKQGATFAKRRRQEQMDGSTRTTEETVFGVNETDGSAASAAAYQTDWVGHDHPVTALVILSQGHDEQRLMISGDELGQVRIWDLESRTCLNIIQPWSQTSALQQPKQSANPSQSSKGPGSHPVTSICIVPQPANMASSSGMFRSSSSHGKNVTSIASMVGPLQKFKEEQSGSGGSATADLVPVPLLKPNRSAENIHYWEARPILRKRRRRQSGKDSPQQKVNGSSSQQQQESSATPAEMADQIKALKEQLTTKQSEVERWEN
ncbi:MAG: hypothetical protein SGILL_009312, partial [Bacillariaceae sp.]